MADPSDLLQEMRDASPKRGPQCSVCRILSTMPDEHADAVRLAFADAKVTDRGIVIWLERNGYDIGLRDPVGGVRSHRQSHE